MAYTAVISLLQTLEQLEMRNPELSQGQTAKTVESLHATAQYFLKILDDVSCKKLDIEKLKYLDETIRVAASDAENVVELSIVKLINGWYFGIARTRILCYQLLSLVEKLDVTKKQVMEIVSDFTTNDDEILDSLIGTCSRSYPMINLDDDVVHGLDDDLELIVERLKGPLLDLDIVTITGMGGIGKTTLARKAYHHPTISCHFDIRVWVTISQEFHNRNVLLDALRCISNVHKKDYDGNSDDELANLVQKNLKGRRYLVVVDDIWSTNVWDSISRIFPDYNNRSRILLTTREAEVALYANPTTPHEMNLLNLDNSWKLLRDKVFGPKHDHPHELEEIGKEIVKKCQGLPLALSVIAGPLSKMARTLESWKDFEQTLGEVVASHPDKCLGVLGLSYHHLPNYLKPCFLSIGCFPEDFEVEMWRLIQLWIAEGFIRTSGTCKSLEEVAKDYLEDLISRNLIMVRKRRFNGEIKTCEMHDLLHEFCLIEAEMTKFMHVERPDHYLVHTLQTPMHNVHRFSLQPDIDSDDNYYKLLPPLARSIYLFCASYRYLPFPSFSHFNLLRVLAILDYIFDSFPLVITKLFHLRYLEIACYGNLPASVVELRNLQALIYEQCCQHYAILPSLPGEIWMMENLRHIHLRQSSYLPNPITIEKKHLVTGMPNLEDLSGFIRSASCTNEFFSYTPNLKRLIIQEDSSSQKNSRSLCNMSRLTKLESLKVIGHSVFSEHSIGPSIDRFVFPTSLKRLTLNCLYCPWRWQDISSICVMLPNLEELKLKAIRGIGETWKLHRKHKFKSLKLLLLSKIDFYYWIASSDSFPNLKCLILKNCKNLEEIPTDFGEICTLESIELYDCGTFAEESARKIEQEQEDMGNNSLKVVIHSTRKICRVPQVVTTYPVLSRKEGQSPRVNYRGGGGGIEERIEDEQQVGEDLKTERVQRGGFISFLDKFSLLFIRVIVYLQKLWGM